MKWIYEYIRNTVVENNKKYEVYYSNEYENRKSNAIFFFNQHLNGLSTGAWLGGTDYDIGDWFTEKKMFLDLGDDKSHLGSIKGH